MTGFYSHRKTAKLRALIGDDAFWIPPRVWAYAAENQPDGNLSSYTSQELSLLIGCLKHSTSIIQALMDCGFVDSDGFIHDWDQHNGYHKSFSDRAKVAAKARWAKEKAPTPPKEEETGKRKGEIGDKHCLEDAPSIYSAYSRTALHWLNEKSGKHFRESETSLAPINARLQEKDVDIEGVKKMLTRQCEMWVGTNMQEFLTPSTLFGKEKFGNYYAAKDLPIQTNERPIPKVKTLFDKEMDRLKRIE